MGVPENQKPDSCICGWEEVMSFEDQVPMIMMTRPDPDCPVHPKG